MAKGSEAENVRLQQHDSMQKRLMTPRMARFVKQQKDQKQRSNLLDRRQGSSSSGGRSPLSVDVTSVRSNTHSDNGGQNRYKLLNKLGLSYNSK